MLEFINNNGVLFSGIFSIIVALISVIVSIIKDNKKNRTDTIRTLRKDLASAQAELAIVRAELEQSQSIEHAEESIDKTHGAIYHEKFANGSRTICGYCWEKEHIKIPIVVDLCYEEYTRQHYYSGYCRSCKEHCIENVTLDTLRGLEDNELPF